MYQRIKTWLLPYVAPLIYISSYNKIKKAIDKCFEQQYQVFCFFPAYHTGGAEKVHAQILKALQPASVVCFITHKSRNDTFKEIYIERSTYFIDINATGNYNYFRKKLVKYLTQKFNSLNYNCTLFGCNAVLFYELLPQVVNNKIKKVDLLHAFSPYANGIENISIHYVKLLEKRIVINQKTYTDYKKQYQDWNIPFDYLDRIEIIENALDENCPRVQKSFKMPLKCLFVGRNSPEKRFFIYQQLAKEANINSLPVEFSAVGDFHQQNTENSIINFYGEVSDKKEMDRIYENHHILITTSIYEGFPLTIMEAMCKGLVNIATNVGGISEHISEKIGFLITPDSDEKALTIAFFNVLKKLCYEPEVLHYLSANTFEYVSDHFQFDHFKSKYNSVLINKAY